MLSLLHVALIAVLTILIAVLWRRQDYLAEMQRAAAHGVSPRPLARDAHGVRDRSLLPGLSFAKSQQGTAAIYSLLIQAALLGMDRLVFAAPLVLRTAWVLTGVLLFLACGTYLFSIHVLYGLQWRLRELRMDQSGLEQPEGEPRSYRLDPDGRLCVALVTVGWLLSVVLMVVLAPPKFA